MISNEIVEWGAKDVTQIPVTFKTAAEAVRDSLEGLDLKEMFDKLDAAIERGVIYAQGSVLYTSYVIALQKDVWDEMGLSDQHGIAESFYSYVSDRFKISDNASTIDNYIHTARLWLLGGIENIPEKTLLFELEGNRAVPVTNKEGDSIFVEPSPWDVNYSKLLIANNRALKGQMEEEDWGLLFSPAVSQNRLLSWWRGPKDTPDDKDPESFTYTMVGSWLCVNDGDTVVQIAEVDDDTIEQNALARQGWMRLKSVLKVEEEEDF